MKEFLEMDKIKSFNYLCERVIQKNNIAFNNNNIEIVSYLIRSATLIIQSSEFQEKSGIPHFLLKVKNDLSFEAYHAGIKCTIKSLSKNRVTVLDTLSKLQEAVRYLFCLEIDQKKSVLLEQVTSMSSLIQVDDKKYTPAVIVRAFEYFVISRSLYKRLREDFELPSIPTLTRITSKVNSTLGDEDYVKNIFKYLEDERHKNCILLIDEVYVKPALLYHGGFFFGHAVNKPDCLSTTILSIMIHYLGDQIFNVKCCQLMI